MALVAPQSRSLAKGLQRLLLQSLIGGQRTQPRAARAAAGSGVARLRTAPTRSALALAFCARVSTSHAPVPFLWFAPPPHQAYLATSYLATSYLATSYLATSNLATPNIVVSQLATSCAGSYGDCCAPLHEAGEAADPLALVRARYTAYTVPVAAALEPALRTLDSSVPLQKSNVGRVRPSEPAAHLPHPAAARLSPWQYRLPDFLMQTTHPESGEWEADATAWKKTLLGFMDDFEFQGLELPEDAADAPPVDLSSASSASVGFRARFVQKGTLNLMVLCEQSTYRKADDGRWLYSAGDVSYEAQD